MFLGAPSKKKHGIFSDNLQIGFSPLPPEANNDNINNDKFV